MSCLSNRSACRFATGDVIGCVEDCSTALAILEIDISKLDSTTSSSSTQFAALTGSSSDVLGAVASAAMLSSILPATGSDKRKSWVLKTATRRGAALAQVIVDVVRYSLLHCC